MQFIPFFKKWFESDLCITVFSDHADNLIKSGRIDPAIAKANDEFDRSFTATVSKKTREKEKKMLTNLKNIQNSIGVGKRSKIEGDSQSVENYSESDTEDDNRSDLTTVSQVIAVHEDLEFHVPTSQDDQYYYTSAQGSSPNKRQRTFETEEIKENDEVQSTIRIDTGALNMTIMDKARLVLIKRDNHDELFQQTSFLYFESQDLLFDYLNRNMVVPEEGDLEAATIGDLEEFKQQVQSMQDYKNHLNRQLELIGQAPERMVELMAQYKRMQAEKHEKINKEQEEAEKKRAEEKERIKFEARRRSQLLWGLATTSTTTSTTPPSPL